MLTFVNYNMHCGMDGWGRPFDYVSAIGSLHADVITIEESWTTEGASESQAEQAARAMGYRVFTHDLGQGRRIREQPDAGASWMAKPRWRPANKALYMDGLRPISASVQALPKWQEAEPGRWGIAVLVSPDLQVDDSRVIPLHHLRVDPVLRAALVVDVTHEGRPLSVAGTHMAHMPYGAHRNWRQLRRALRVGARPDAVLAGDMNTWSPVVRSFMPEWHRAVKGRSWPTQRPHSQIDHILVRGALRPVAGEVLPHAGSDHRPVRAVIALA